jgi:UDP-glucose 4-epimerase
MKVLITGGAGYIGSTICSALIDQGHTPIILDSLITGKKEFTKDRIFYQGDIADITLLKKIFSEHPDIQGTIHCAALIVVPESVDQPYEYYTENVGKSTNFFHHLHQLGYPRVVFSSSAAIYDAVPGFMVNESSPLNPNSPYSRTKYIMELVLKDFCCAYQMKGIALRYFNPIGADPKMRSGIHAKNPSHILGKLVDVARGKQPVFQITGTTWPTRDGTGIRDYIHVWDLASAHINAMEHFDQVMAASGSNGCSYQVINLGTGRGVTVREMVTAFEKVYGHTVEKVEVDPRPGDVAGAYTNADTALRLLNWKAEMTLEQGISDALKWGDLRKERLGYE